MASEIGMTDFYINDGFFVVSTKEETSCSNYWILAGKVR